MRKELYKVAVVSVLAYLGYMGFWHLCVLLGR